MPVPRKIRDAEDADACLQAVEHSGGSLRDWSHANGIDARSLNIWRVLRSRGRGTAPPKPAGLRLVELIADRPTVEAVKPSYRVQCGDFTIDVSGSFDDHELRRLLHVVRSC